MPWVCSEPKSNTRMRGSGAKRKIVRPVPTWSRICAWVAVCTANSGAGGGVAGVTGRGGTSGTCTAACGGATGWGHQKAKPSASSTARLPAAPSAGSQACAGPRRAVAAGCFTRTVSSSSGSGIVMSAQRIVRGGRDGRRHAPTLITCTRRLRGSGVCGGVGTSRPASPRPSGCSRLACTPNLDTRYCTTASARCSDRVLL